jgi:hypothetical protein
MGLMYIITQETGKIEMYVLHLNIPVALINYFVMSIFTIIMLK